MTIPLAFWNGSRVEPRSAASEFVNGAHDSTAMSLLRLARGHKDRPRLLSGARLLPKAEPQLLAWELIGKIRRISKLCNAWVH
jgi:hypothetical protein